MSTQAMMDSLPSKPCLPIHRTFRALANRTRLGVSRLLQECRSLISGIVSVLKVPRAKASNHVRHLCQAWLIAVAACVAATEPAYPAEDEEADGQTYVILTDLRQQDPYYEAVRRLQQHRSAQTVRFDADRLDDALDAIRRLGPQFVAIVVRPHTIDINFAYDVLELSTNLDDDPFPDFAYGFITGATADDAVGLVDNIIRAESARGQLPLRMVAFGPSGVAQVDDGSMFDWAPEWRQVRFAHKPGHFPGSRRDDLASNGIIRLWGHGVPEAVVDGLTSRDIQGVDLFPGVVFAGPCYSAVTARSFVPHGCTGAVTVHQLAPERSLALTFLSRGACGYFGALAEDLCLSAGQEMEYALTTGLPLGMSAKHTYDDVVVGGGGKPISFARFGAERPAPVTDAVGRKLRDAASRVLLGDPAYRPFAKAADPPWSATVQRAAGGLTIVATLDDPRIRCGLVDPFRSELCACGARNDRLYLIVEMPPSLATVKHVSCAGLEGDTVGARDGDVRWVEEGWLGKRLLHLQMDFRHGYLGRATTGGKLVFQVEEANGPR